MLTVEKIGGTSMNALDEVLKNIILYERTGDQLYNSVFVVSAFSGVTDMLLKIKKSGKPGVSHKNCKRSEFPSPFKRTDYTVETSLYCYCTC